MIATARCGPEGSASDVDGRLGRLARTPRRHLRPVRIGQEYPRATDPGEARGPSHAFGLRQPLAEGPAPRRGRTASRLPSSCQTGTNFARRCAPNDELSRMGRIRRQPLRDADRPGREDVEGRRLRRSSSRSKSREPVLVREHAPSSALFVFIDAPTFGLTGQSWKEALPPRPGHGDGRRDPSPSQVRASTWGARPSPLL